MQHHVAGVDTGQLPCNSTHTHGNCRGITAFPITVSFSTTHTATNHGSLHQLAAYQAAQHVAQFASANGIAKYVLVLAESTLQVSIQLGIMLGLGIGSGLRLGLELPCGYPARLAVQRLSKLVGFTMPGPATHQDHDYRLLRLRPNCLIP